MILLVILLFTWSMHSWYLKQSFSKVFIHLIQKNLTVQFCWPQPLVHIWLVSKLKSCLLWLWNPWPLCIDWLTFPFCELWQRLRRRFLIVDFSWLWKMFQNWTNFFFVKYIGVQSWKAAHLSTLEIRVKQKKNRVKREKNEGKKKNNQCCLDRESNPGPVDNWPNVCFDKSGPLEDTV